MSDQARSSMEGRWVGVYMYQGDNNEVIPRPFPFEARVECQDGRLSGSVSDVANPRKASISGSVNAGAIEFEKRYEDPKLDAVKYRGTLGEDGATANGTWELHGKDKTLRGVWQMGKAKPWWKAW